jgi:hypothetical protein
MQVWTYPEKRREELGAKRWEVRWWTRRAGTDANAEDIDFDRDIEENGRAFKTYPAAKAFAEKIYPESCFGCASIQQQVVDWFVEEDRVAEWADVGDSEEVS